MLTPPACIPFRPSKSALNKTHTFRFYTITMAVWKLSSHWICPADLYHFIYYTTLMTGWQCHVSWAICIFPSQHIHIMQTPQACRRKVVGCSTPKITPCNEFLHLQQDRLKPKTRKTEEKQSRNATDDVTFLWWYVWRVFILGRHADSWLCFLICPHIWSVSKVQELSSPLSKLICTIFSVPSSLPCRKASGSKTGRTCSAGGSFPCPYYW